MMEFWILDENHRPVREPNLIEWNRWLQKNHHVKFDTIGPYTVSTVFLGFDHAMPPNPAAPLLFETTAFQPKTETEVREAQAVADKFGLPPAICTPMKGLCQFRCSTWDEAIAQHARVARDVSRLAAG